MNAQEIYQKLNENDLKEAGIIFNSLTVSLTHSKIFISDNYDAPYNCGLVDFLMGNCRWENNNVRNGLDFYFSK